MLGEFLHNEGVLLVQKPIGMSSFAVVKAAQKALKTKKAGHAGTLDPLASGLMIIGTGRYTKLLGYLSDCDKVYDVTVRLGIRTSTDDSEGAILEEKPLPTFSEEEIRVSVDSFVGDILQLPPKYSAIKVEGKRAYALSRKDVDFELSPRKVTLHQITIEKIALPDIHLRVHCSKGSYMRALARDLGDKLGVGGYAASIHRVAIGCFSVDQAEPLTTITEQHLLRGTSSINTLPSIAVSLEDAIKLRMGKRVILPDETAFVDEGIAHHQNELIAVVRRQDNTLLSIRGI